MKITDAKNGVVYKEDGQPLLVLKYSHTKMGRGTATIRVKVKNLLTGVIQEKSYINSYTLEPADVSKKTVQFLYKDEDNCMFMDPTTFEQFNIDNETVGEKLNYLNDGSNVFVTYFEETPILVETLINEKFSVTYTEPAEKGDTSGRAYKPATINTGATVMVPLFINTNDTIVVNTDTGDYVERG
ncbi:MAG: elongation factor P [bacterium]|nr:elongation factor P [bacterium]